MTLLEVLVAVVVLSVGLLAMAKAHLHAMHAQRTGAHDAAASALLADMAGRMQANVAGLTAKAYDMPPERLSLAPDRDATHGTHRACTVADAGCTPEDMAQQDLRAWRQRVIWALPGSAAWLEWKGPEQTGQIWLLWSEVSRLPATAGTPPRDAGDETAALVCPDALLQVAQVASTHRARCRVGWVAAPFGGSR